MAEDSAPKQEALVPVVPTKVTNQWGGTSERLRGPKGQFVKKEKPLPPADVFIRARRKKMMNKRPNTDLTEHQALFQELLDILHRPVEKDAKTGLSDAKMVMAKLKAAELILLYTEGKPMTSELDKGNEKVQPVKVVLLPSPTLMYPELIDGDKREKEKHAAKDDQPSFIDADFVEVKN